MNKKPHLFSIAMRNIKAYGWINAKLCFTFACLAFLICLFTIYNSALRSKYDVAVKERISSNYIYTSIPSKWEKITQELGQSILNEDTYKSRNFTKESNELCGIGMENLKTEYLTLATDEKEYNAVTKMRLGCLTDPQDGFFSEYDYISLKQLYDCDDPYLVGGRPLGDNEVAVSEDMLMAYKLKTEDVLGKQLNGYLRPLVEGKQPLLLFSAKVSGVIRSEVSRLFGHSFPASNPSLLFNRSNPLFEKSCNTYNRMFLSDWPDETTTIDWFSAYGNVYAGDSSVKLITGLKNIKTLGANLYFIIGCALFMGLVLTVFMMVNKYAKIFSKFGGVLLTLGLKQNKLMTLLLLQLLILCAVAVPISFVLTYLGYRVITGIIAMIANITFEISIAELIKMFAVGMILVVIIALIFFAYMALILHNKTIKQLLVTALD